MKRSIFLMFAVLAAAGIAGPAVADDDFYGIVESRPEGKAGPWMIGGRSVEVTDQTDLDEDDGPLDVGICAEVDIDRGRVEEIESEPAEKCRH